MSERSIVPTFFSQGDIQIIHVRFGATKMVFKMRANATIGMLIRRGCPRFVTLSISFPFEIMLYKKGVQDGSRPRFLKPQELCMNVVCTDEGGYSQGPCPCPCISLHACPVPCPTIQWPRMCICTCRSDHHGPLRETCHVLPMRLLIRGCLQHLPSLACVHLLGHRV